MPMRVFGTRAVKPPSTTAVEGTAKIAAAGSADSAIQHLWLKLPSMASKMRGNRPGKYF